MQHRPYNPEEEFIKAYDELSDALFRHAIFRVSDREVALDIVQEGFVRTWQHAKAGNVIINWRSFLYRVINNLIIDYYRKSKSESLDVLAEGGFEPVINDHENITLSSEISLVRRALKVLPEHDRDVVVMRHIDGMSVKDIAEVLGESENVISVRLHRAIKKVQKLMKQ
jgi:RNA polymerase sigma-70 factor (ECF subfamily)